MKSTKKGKQIILGGVVAIILLEVSMYALLLSLNQTLNSTDLATNALKHIERVRALLIIGLFMFPIIASITGFGAFLYAENQEEPTSSSA